MGDIKKTEHKIFYCNANRIKNIKDESIHLVVTSPPYPMIEMWDSIFSEQNKDIEKALKNNKGRLAFELMHQELDLIWEELDRVLIPGGISCINIGDATRTIDKKFSLYSNHGRILQKFIDLGHHNLPNILWRKVTNAPNKFMGSGMLPVGAYVTLEHEWILIFRKGRRREFKTLEQKVNRKESSYFWEERNIWFSDLWNFSGTKQKLNTKKSRDRSAAYPFEVPYRLINMFSVKGEIVLDPFLGTGTTTLASMLLERNSVGIEIDVNLRDIITNRIKNQSVNQLNDILIERINTHKSFIENFHKPLKYFNHHHEIPVMTEQEIEISINAVDKIKGGDNRFYTYYKAWDKSQLIFDSSNSTETGLSSFL